MDWIPVSSTNIARVRFEVTSLTLEIEFHGGRIYQYFDVPQHVYEALLSAESQGTYFNENIKGVYRYARM